jgi:transposase
MSNESIQMGHTGRRSRFPALEKKRIVEETYEKGSSVSYVARQYGVSPSLLYQWRRSMEDGALVGVDCEDEVVSKKEIKALNARIRELEGALGRKTLDNDILKEAVKLGREKKLISRQPLVGLEDFK